MATEIERKKWVESKVDELEKFIVIKPVRLRDNRTGKASSKNVGEVVELSGLIKKTLYFSGHIAYAEDAKKIKNTLKEKEEKVNG